MVTAQLEYNFWHLIVIYAVLNFVKILNGQLTFASITFNSFALIFLYSFDELGFNDKDCIPKLALPNIINISSQCDN